MEKNELTAVYEVLLSAPGMEDNLRVDLRISRKVSLFLVDVIEKGLQQKSASDHDLLSLSSAVKREELEDIVKSILEKSGMTDTHKRLQFFKGKQ